MINISVIIPVYNRRNVILTCLNSAIKQTYTAYEIIIIDDGSNDGISEFISINFPEVVLITLPINVGAAQARNIGLRSSRGEFIAFLDSDDFWAPDYLLSQSIFLQKNPTIDLVFSAHSNALASKAFNPPLKWESGQYT
ncbi:glycosyltransferase family 2 protein [Pedobacter mucosus]|uniref:glycosyltransferase family 2 protein n=1 Tax=Pedobacter mucosus TaxID=2895286 RepID=UPI001EE3B0AC|nr:glycosyltransferase family A protein [Pedobacter mucosus]UKT64301.1 glycosyltransferase family 2 protein [Pedobacter mucosus]